MTREEAIEVYHGLINTKIKEAFEFFAPELAESEDEMIRKEAISIVQSYMSICYKEGDPCLSGYKVLAWLEKQKEQKPVEWHKFNPADEYNGVAFRIYADFVNDDGFIAADIEDFGQTPPSHYLEYSELRELKKEDEK